jgi:hypothetical protein
MMGKEMIPETSGICNKLTEKISLNSAVVKSQILDIIWIISLWFDTGNSATEFATYMSD